MKVVHKAYQAKLFETQRREDAENILDTKQHLTVLELTIIIRRSSSSYASSLSAQSFTNKKIFDKILTDGIRLERLVIIVS